MKLVNHHKDNYTYDDTHDGSVMNGTIYMTAREWADMLKRLRKAYDRATRDCNTRIRDGLAHVFNWTLKHHGDKKRVCLGVTATSLIALKYNLKRYKHQNYVIERIEL